MLRKWSGPFCTSANFLFPLLQWMNSKPWEQATVGTLALSRTPHLQRYDLNGAVSAVSLFCLWVKEWNGHHCRCWDCPPPPPLTGLLRTGTERCWDTQLAMFSVFLTNVSLQSHVMLSLILRIARYMWKTAETSQVVACSCLPSSYGLQTIRIHLLCPLCLSYAWTKLWK